MAAPEISTGKRSHFAANSTILYNLRKQISSPVTVNVACHLDLNDCFDANSSARSFEHRLDFDTIIAAFQCFIKTRSSPSILKSNDELGGLI
jgi:hypothetical protein